MEGYDRSATLLGRAFNEGRAAFEAGKPLTVNPYLDGQDRGAMQGQWHRGYVNTRKTARFNATITERENQMSKYRRRGQMDALRGRPANVAKWAYGCHGSGKPKPTAQDRAEYHAGWNELDRLFRAIDQMNEHTKRFLSLYQ